MPTDDDSGFDEFVDDPWESGIPGSNYENMHDLYESMVDDYGIRGDEYAEMLLYEGWYSDSGDSDTRVGARDAFYEFMGWDDDYNDFDWDAWREAYGEAA